MEEAGAQRLGRLDLQPVLDRLDLVAGPVAALLRRWPPAGAVRVAEIDPEMADTAAFCAHYEVGLDVSANCVVVAARRGAEIRHAACVVLATTRADVNGVVRRRLDARKVSFAARGDVEQLTGMEHGGITAPGLPESWPVLVADGVVAAAQVVVGSGLRRSKLVLPGRLLAELPAAQTLQGLARPATGDAGPA